MRTTPVSTARSETSRAPRGAVLERLYRLAAKHHPPSAKVFRLALDREKESESLRRRLGEILDPLNIREANEKLRQIWEAQRWLRQSILHTPSIDGVDQHILIAADEVQEQVRGLADLICIDGRKESGGEDE